MMAQLYKVRYKNSDGVVLSRQGSNLLDVQGECDGTIVAMYAWKLGGWEKIYNLSELKLGSLDQLIGDINEEDYSGNSARALYCYS